MDRAQLLQHFDTLAETPEAVEKLRSFVLDLAVRGRLVPQASKPDKDTAWLKFCAELNDPAKSNGEMPPPPFDAPEHWRWAFLEQVAEPCGQKKPDVRFTYVDVGAIDNVRGIITPDVQVLEADEAPSRARKLVRSGSVIYSTVRPYLRNIAVVDRKFDPPPIVSTAFAVLHPEPILDVRFLFHWLRSGPFQNDVAAKMKGVAYPAISNSEFWQCQIPVPPPAEQRRIVAKVEELLALCEELEARQTAAREHRTRLARSALDHLTTAKDETDFKKRSSFCIQNSELLFDSVPALRQAILALAVEGHLVPQNPKDEPASKILASIRSDVAAAVRSKRMKARKSLPRIDEANLPFLLPQGWEWAQLGELTAAESNAMLDGPFGSKLKTSHYVSTTGYAVIRLGNLGVGNFIWGKEGHITKEHYDSLSTNHVAYGDLIIAGLAEPLGRCCEVPKELGPAVNKSDCFRFRPHRAIDRRYIVCYMNSPIGRKLAEASNHGMTRSRINSLDAKALAVALPPVAEQQRIVAKVDELLRWCDALAARLTAAQTTATHLLDSTLRALLAA